MTESRLRDRPRARTLAAVGLTLLAWLLVAGVVAAELWRERGREVEKAKVAATATTALMAANTARNFQVVDLALEEVARRLEEGPLPANDPRLRAVMRARLNGMPYVRALYVIGPDGFILHDTDYPDTPHVSLADRDYFQLHRSSPALLSAISAPLKSRSGLGWFVAVTRRIGDGQTFQGIVVAAIQLRDVTDLYERMGLGQGQGHVILLFRRDGRLMAQHPGESAIGQSFADAPLFRFHLPRTERGVYITHGPPLPSESIFSYEAVGGQPLVVGLSQDIQAVLEPWRRVVALAAAGLALLLLMMQAGTAFILREQRRRQRAIERRRQGEKMEALGQLTGSIAHDFGNLMGIVGSNLEIVRRLAGGNGATAVAVGRAQRALDNGARMTRQLLSFARARQLSVADVDVHALLRDALPLLQQAAGSGVKLVEDCAPGPALCRLDPTQLEVALINLVANARDAMDGQGRIVLRTRRDARMERRAWWRRRRALPVLDLSVEDDGPGMPESVRRRALEPFFTTKGEAGTGLGLAQVHGLVDQLGGEVRIDSRPGEGTRVHLLLPMRPEPARPAAA